MDWPTAAIIIAALATVAPVVYKMLPSKKTDNSGVSHKDIHDEIHQIKSDLETKISALSTRIDRALELLVKK